MILLIDDYDGFSYDLVRLSGSLAPNIWVIRNDEMTADEIKELCSSHVIPFPGSDYPKNVGVYEDVIREMKGIIPILGVCLGHQAICEVPGTAIIHVKELMYGKQNIISPSPGCPLFTGLPDQIPAARYHSLIASRETLSDEFLIAAQDDMGEIVAVQHRKFPIYGLQFHSESIMMLDGVVVLKNLLEVILRYGRQFTT